MPKSTLTPHQLPEAEFRQEFETAVQGARGAITELLASAGQSDLTPKIVSSRLAIGANLAWKISRVIRADDSSEVLRHLPGTQGVQILLKAAANLKVERQVLEKTRTVLREFDSMVRRHCGSRANLTLLLASSAEDGMTAAAEEARKLSFRGNATTWGVQALTQLAVQIHLPNAINPNRVDTAQISGLIGFTRLRSSVRWPVVRFQWDLDEQSLADLEIETLELGKTRANEAPLFREYCSSPTPRVEAREVKNGMLYELCEGPVGDTAALDCLVGTVLRDYSPAYSTPENTEASLFMSLSTPVESALFEVYYHRDIAPREMPASFLSSRLELGAAELHPSEYGMQLPLSKDVQQLGSPPVSATPITPRHSEMMQTAFQKLGVSPDDLVGYRIAVRYPPIPSRLFMNCVIPTKAAN